MSSFSDRLKTARAQSNYTQAELARICDVSQSTIASYENGERRSSRSVRKLAKALKVEAEWLETGHGPMRANPLAYQLANASPHTLSESNAYWPFSVAPTQVQQLNARQLRTLDALVRAYLENLPPTPGRRK